MTLNRILSALFVIEILVAGTLFTATVSRAAFDLDELGLSRPDNLDVNTIREGSGLDGDPYAHCDESYYDVNGILGGIANDAGSILQDSATNALSTMIECAVDNVLSKFTWIGGGSFLGSGATVGFRNLGIAAMECVRVGASDAKAELRAQLNYRLQANNMASCTTATGNAAINETVLAMINTQGPDGGVAYVRNYTEWLRIRPERMAERRIWAILANTQLCPHFKDAVLDAVRVPQSYRDNPPPLGADGFAVDGGTPPALRWRCTLPAGFDGDWSTDESYIANGGLDGLMLATSGANNPDTLMQMIQTEYQQQTEAMKEAAYSMANGGSGGYLPVMSECLADPESNACLQYGSIKQVPGGTRDIVDSSRDALNDEWNRATGEQGAVSDVANRLRIQLLDLANNPLPLELESAPQNKPENYKPAMTSTPDPSQPAPTPDPTDPLCFDGNPACECPPPMSQGTLRNIAMNVIRMGMEEVGGLFSGGGSGRDYLYNLCEEIDKKFQIQCHPHPLLNDRIVLDIAGNNQISFIVLLPNGQPRIWDGGTASRMCTDGSM